MNNGIIVVPFRNREEHLAAFLPHYKKLLPDMPILVVEQADEKPFNRAKLLNIGFLEAGCKYSHCVYHDVDMLAEDANGYGLYANPIHLASAAEQFGYKLPFKEYFGGVVNIPNHIMLAVNGFSNNFYGWGGEDCQMYRRLLDNDFEPHRIDGKRYKSLQHASCFDATLHKENVKLLNTPNDPTDGLSSCVYEVVDVATVTGYDIDPSSGNIKGEYEYLHIKATL